MRLLAREGRLGAHESRGEGYFSAEYELRLSTNGGDFAPAGALRIADFDVRLEGAKGSIECALKRSGSLLEDARGKPA